MIQRRKQASSDSLLIGSIDAQVLIHSFLKATLHPLSEDSDHVQGVTDSALDMLQCHEEGGDVGEDVSNELGLIHAVHRSTAMFRDGLNQSDQCQRPLQEWLYAIRSKYSDCFPEED